MVAGNGVALAFENRDVSTIDVGMLAGEGEMVLVTSDNGTNPVLADLGDKVMVAYLQMGAAMVQVFSWDGTILVPPTQIPVDGDFTGDLALSVRGGIPVLWGFQYHEPLGTIVDMMLDEQGDLVAEQRFRSAAAFPSGLFACSDDWSSVLVWGEMTGSCGVGVHGMVFAGSLSQRGDMLLGGPGLISESIAHQSASYSLWPVCAITDGVGFVVWGGWQEDAYYGLYGRTLNYQGL